jgi:hypothetical protein
MPGCFSNGSERRDSDFDRFLKTYLCTEGSIPRRKPLRPTAVREQMKAATRRTRFSHWLA